MDGVYDFIANTSDGVFAVDCEQTIVLWNEAAASVLGYRPAETLGKKCYGILQGRDAEGCAVCRRGCEAIEAAQHLDLTATQDLMVRTKQGDEIWLNLSTVVIPSESRQLSALVHLFREVSRQHEALRVVREVAEVVSGISGTARAGRPRRALDANACVRLTRREREILGHLVAGVTTETISERLSISQRTVRNHVANILEKLGVHSRLEAVVHSIRNGLV